jgi:hypothetical protein
VVAYSESDYDAIYAASTGAGAITAEASADGTVGVRVTHSGPSNSCVAVQGTCASGRGVAGLSTSWQGVYGHSHSQAGVVGESDEFDGVWGRSLSGQHAGTTGINAGGGIGVFGWSGIDAQNNVTGNGVAVHGSGSGAATGVEGISDSGDAIHGNSGGGRAGFFEGRVEITGDLIVHGDICLPVGGDLAENFAKGDESIEPGTVVVIGDEDTLMPSREAYDRRVAGVVSGAGSYRPGLYLSKGDGENRCPLALIGRAFCRVDGDAGPIAIGDLLTTSTTPGHAMKAIDPLRSAGAILGKALRALEGGKGLIPILVVLN